MSQRRPVLVFPNSNQNSRLSKLDGVKCKMLPAHSSELPSLAKKAAKLHAARPAAASLLEKLLDDLLADVG